MSDFDFMELISAPIIAMNEAESDNALRFVELLHEMAFVEDPSTGTQKLRTLEFSFDRIEADGSTQTHIISIPLFQFMPLNGVSIEQATLNYALKLQANKPDKNGKMRMLGRMAEGYEKDTGLTGNVNVEIKLKKIDLPQGVLSLIETAQTAVLHKRHKLEEPIPAPEPTPPRPNISAPFMVVKMLEQSPHFIEPGQDHVGKFSINISEAVKKNKETIKVKLSSWPKSALEFEDNKSFIIRDDKQLKLFYLASPLIERYSERTKIKLIMNAEVMSATGEIVKQKIEFPLTRKG